MNYTRKAAVAGSFYPSDPIVLRNLIGELLADTESRTPRPPKAMVVPHAGYRYSGPIAASAYGTLKGRAHHIRRVILIGPAHRIPFDGVALSGAASFETPLGSVPIDRQAVEDLLQFPFVGIDDLSHAPEHCLEVQLPFLQEILEDFRLVPALVGNADPAQVAAVLERLWGNEETLLVVSSDLSHYENYETAKMLDQRTTHAIEQLRPDQIRFQDACGRLPISGLLLAARHHRLSALTLDLRNSGDTAGDKVRVVGYGAYLLLEPGPVGAL